MGKTPKEIRDVSPGVAASKNVIHSSTSESNNQSIGVLAEDISRLQTSVKHYSTSSGTYKVDDIVLDPNISSPLIYINLIAVTTPEVFDPEKWRLTGISSVFNSKGDLLGYTGTDPTNISVGSDNQVLTADSVADSGVAWKTPVQYSPPVTTKGDIFGFDTDDNRIPVGTNNQVLTADSAQALGVAWKTPVIYSPPVTTKGDIFGFDTDDNRIPVGTNDQVLTADSAQALGVAWKTPVHYSSPLSAKGDILTNNGTVDDVLSKGTDGQLLTVDDSQPVVNLNWKTLQSSIKDYSESLTYKVGDVVSLSTHPQRSYINITAVTTSEPFDSAKWKIMGLEHLLTAKGDLLVYFGTNTSNFPVGSNGQILSPNSLAPGGLQWINPALEEIGRVEVASNSSTIIVPLSKQKKNLFVKFLIIPTASMLAQMRFNNDTLATISELMVDDFTTVSSQIGDNDIQISDVAGESTPMSGTINITNIISQIKQGMVLKTGVNGTTSGTTPTTKTNAFKWINTVAGISEIRFIVTGGTGLYGIGSYVIVYGFD